MFEWAAIYELQVLFRLTEKATSRKCFKLKQSDTQDKKIESYTNTSRAFHVETMWKRPFPRRFNVECTWCIWRDKRFYRIEPIRYDGWKPTPYWNIKIIKYWIPNSPRPIWTIKRNTDYKEGYLRNRQDWGVSRTPINIKNGVLCSII